MKPAYDVIRAALPQGRVGRWLNSTSSRTGISGLDVILAAGIPRGNVILLEGGIGAGKTTMGVEFVYRGATKFD